MKKVTKIFALLLVLALALSLTACGGKKEESPVGAVEKIQAKGQLVVGTSADYPPYEFHTEIDGKDTIVGFDIAIAQAVADSMGVELKIVDMSFDNLLMSLANGEFDMVIAGMTSNEERLKTTDFSEPYLMSKNLILVRTEDAGKYTTLEDLQGAKGGAQTGSIPFDRCVTYCGAETSVGLAKVQDLIMELQAGKLDVVFLDYMTVLTYAAVNDNLSAVDVNIPSESKGYSIAVQKGNTELTEYINGVLEQLAADNAVEGFVVEAQQLAGMEE
ncbi:MAG: transporter substrate-binding domain-containing protein [Oscillospiraceae bacterium]|nr:transporter substrate-binding domain-containing protein [Oscillospiraceae bacterium]